MAKITKTHDITLIFSIDKEKCSISKNEKRENMKYKVLQIKTLN